MTRKTDLVVSHTISVRTAICLWIEVFAWKER
jgi:hypothetical protein